MTAAEEYFNRHRQAVTNAASVKEAINSYCSDFELPESRKLTYAQGLMKAMNKLFRGDLDKVKKYLIRQLIEDQENYETRDLFI